MHVSIFSAPELIVTDLTHYLPQNATAITLHSTCPMRSAAHAYAYTHQIPLFELAPSTLPSTTLQDYIASTLQQLLSKSDSIIIFSNHFSPEAQAAIAYCRTNNLPFTAFTLTPTP